MRPDQCFAGTRRHLHETRCAGLGDDVDLASAEFAVLCVKVAGKYAELGDRIEIGDDRRSHVDVFLGVAAVDDEGVGELALAMNRNCARIQIRGGGQSGRADILHRVGSDGTFRSYAGLKGQQVRKAAAVQGHRLYLLTVDDLAHLAAVSLYMNGAIVDGHRVGTVADVKHNIEQKVAICIEHNSSAAIRSEAGQVHLENIAADGNDGEGVCAAAVCGGGLPDARVGIHQSDGCFGNGGSGRIFDCARDASAHPRPGGTQQAKNQTKAEQCYFWETSQNLWDGPALHAGGAK